MSRKQFNSLLSVSLKSGVAMLPLAIAFAQMPASAQPKTQAQLEQEAAAAKAAAATGAEADDAEAAALLFGGLTGGSKTTENTKDIVVTGTQIRGVAPTGTNLTVVTKEDIEATGQSSVGQILAMIPGFSTFNSLPNVFQGSGGQGAIQVARPNLRGTPDGDNGGALADPGSSTLILVDGNRQSGGGIRMVATDPESISPALLERVEINTDGGSAAYGSDAIGGVVNFVTKRRYNGAEASGRLGYADDYWQYDGNLLVGKDWGSGSAYISGNYAYNTPLYTGDRDYLLSVALADGLNTSTNCELPNISVAGLAGTGSGTNFTPTIPTHFYRVNADGTIARSGDVISNGVRTTAGTGTPSGGLATSQPNEGQPSDSSRPNLCNNAIYAARVNKNERYGLNLNLFQKITDDIDFLARGSYSHVSAHSINAPSSLSIPVSVNNPFRQELRAGANGTGTTQASYPTAQVGFPTPLNDVFRPCTTTATCTLLNGVVVASTTPGAVVMPNGTLVGVPHTVVTNLGPVYGFDDSYGHNFSDKIGGNAEVNWRIDGNWLLKVSGGYDRTTTKVQFGISSFSGTSFLNPHQDNPSLGATTPCNSAIAAFANAGGHTAANAGNATAIARREAAKQVCLNPYNPEASNPAFLASAHDVESKSLAHQAIINGKFNLDGALVEIPGGKIRVAIGGEYLVEDWEKWQSASGPTGIPFSELPTRTDGNLTVIGSRWVASLYGEANIPLISRANELTWVKELRISISGRYDKYKIFGASFNPKIGASFKPTSWLTIRGNWNTSFRAPNLILSINAEGSRININEATGGLPFGTLNPPLGLDQVVWNYPTTATRKDLKPQTGNQWSLGFDLTPFRGFRASVSYGYINYLNSLVQGGNPATLAALRGTTLALANFGLPDLPGQGCNESNSVVNLDPRELPCTNAQIAAGRSPMIPLTPAQVEIAKKAFVEGALNAAEVLADTRSVYALIDSRAANAGNSKIGNLDYRMSYNSRTPWGQVSFSVNGNVRMINKDQSSATAPFNDNLEGRSRHSMTATAGFTYGPLRASASLAHSDGFRVTRSAASPQDKVGAFNLFNLFATWDFKGDNVVERGLQLSLSINNILNTSPPVRYSNSLVTTANGSTLGRLVQAGFNKKF